MKNILKKFFPKLFCEHEYGESEIIQGTFCDSYTRFCKKCGKEYTNY